MAAKLTENPTRKISKPCWGTLGLIQEQKLENDLVFGEARK